jgi:hypothetical protein
MNLTRSILKCGTPVTSVNVPEIGCEWKGPPSTTVTLKLENIVSMPGGRLLHVKLSDFTDRLLAISLRWLDINQEWLERNYDEVVSELCRVVATNVKDFSNKPKMEHTYRQIEESSLISIAYSVERQDTSGHCVIGCGGEDPVLYSNVDFSLTVWIGPAKSRCSNWPVDCVSNG